MSVHPPQEWIGSPTSLRTISWPFTCGCLSVAGVFVAAAVSTWNLVSFAFLAVAYLVFGLLGQGLYRAWNRDVLKLTMDDTELGWGWTKSPGTQQKVRLASITVVNVSWGDEEFDTTVEVVTRRGDYLKIPVAFTRTYTPELMAALTLRSVPIKESGQA